MSESDVGQRMLGPHSLRACVLSDASRIRIHRCSLAPSGNGSLFGLTVGIYDIMQLIVSPFIGVTVHKVGYKAVFLLSLALQVIGNIIYALLLYMYETEIGKGVSNPHVWIGMLFARAIMGLGSGGIVAGSIFIVEHTTMEDRSDKLGTYRVMQALARMFGPMISLFFIDFLNTSTRTGEILNFYTLPGWLAALCGIEAMVFVYLKFDESSFKKVHQGVEANAHPRYPRLYEALITAFVIKVVWGCVLWAFYSQIFGFGAGRFHVIRLESLAYLPYLGVAVGTPQPNRCSRQSAARACPLTYRRRPVLSLPCCRGAMLHLSLEVCELQVPEEVPLPREVLH